MVSTMNLYKQFLSDIDNNIWKFELLKEIKGENLTYRIKVMKSPSNHVVIVLVCGD